MSFHGLLSNFAPMIRVAGSLQGVALNLVLMSFGTRLENHTQGSFALLSFLKDPRLARIVIVTDQPDFYRVFGDRIECITVDERILDEWQGPHRFFWRIKIKAIEAAVARDPAASWLYVDSDTFLATDLGDMDAALQQGTAFMHCPEDRLADAANSTLKQMHRSLSGKTVSGIAIHDGSVMWNAGVIALPAGGAPALMELTLSLCDALCATDCRRKLIEQFSFSLALAHGGLLQGCYDTIGHYWGNKPEWNAFIARFWSEAKLRQEDLAACVERAARTDWKAMALEKRRSSAAERIKAFIDRLLPPRVPRHFGG